MIVLRRRMVVIACVVLSLVVGFVMSFSFLQNDVYNATGSVTVVIDAGHGGIDNGVLGKKTKTPESQINLAVTMNLKSYLETAGVNVVLTRNSPAGLYGTATKGFKKRDMQKRKEIIESAKPVAVISIHQNFFSLSSKRGAQVFFKETSENGIKLANSIQNKLNGLEETPRDLQPLKGDYFMLNCTDFTSVIVECGFLSNEEDEKLLVTTEYQLKMAYTIFSGIISYLSDEAFYITD